MIVKSANHKRIVNVPKSYLWRRMSDFKNVGSLLPPPIIDEVKCESNDIGSLRYLTLGKKQKYPGEIIERLEAMYDESFFVYSIGSLSSSSSVELASISGSSSTFSSSMELSSICSSSAI